MNAAFFNTGITSYFGALRYINMVTHPKMIFGIQAARTGEKLLFVEKVRENLSITTKSAAMIIPRARWSPLPPRVFLEAMIAPMIVKRKTENGVASRRYLSTL